MTPVMPLLLGLLIFECAVKRSVLCHHQERLDLQIPDALLFVPPALCYFCAQLHVALRAMSFRKVFEVTLDFRSVGKEM
jgi:hypothetical protein